MIILEKFDLVFECGEILVLGDSGRLDVNPILFTLYTLLSSQKLNLYFSVLLKETLLYINTHIK